MAVSGSLIAQLNLTYSDDTGILAGVPTLIPLAWPSVYVTGNAADQVNRLHIKTYNLIASTPQTINLKSLTDFRGNTFTDLARVRRIGLRPRSTTDAATVTLGDDGTANEWISLLTSGSKLTLRASTALNAAFMWITAPNTTAYAVGATNRLLKVAPSAHAIDMDVVIEGST